MWGKKHENGFWVAHSNSYKFMFKGHDSLYIALWRLRLRLMKSS